MIFLADNNKFLNITDNIAAPKIDILAKLITFSLFENANSEVKIAIVNPIPVSIATSVIDLHETFFGFSAKDPSLSSLSDDITIAKNTPDENSFFSDLATLILNDELRKESSSFI